MKWIAVSLESNIYEKWNTTPEKLTQQRKLPIFSKQLQMVVFFRCHVFQACKTRKRIQQQTEHGLEPVRENKNTSPWSRGFKGYNEANYLRTIQHISLLLNVDMTKKTYQTPARLLSCFNAQGGTNAPMTWQSHESKNCLVPSNQKESGMQRLTVPCSWPFQWVGKCREQCWNQRNSIFYLSGRIKPTDLSNCTQSFHSQCANHTQLSKETKYLDSLL